jgi:hypothetical protein
MLPLGQLAVLISLNTRSPKQVVFLFLNNQPHVLKTSGVSNAESCVPWRGEQPEASLLEVCIVRSCFRLSLHNFIYIDH